MATQAQRVSERIAKYESMIPKEIKPPKIKTIPVKMATLPHTNCPLQKRIEGYITHLEERKTPRNQIDTIFILKNIIKGN